MNSQLSKCCLDILSCSSLRESTPLILDDLSFINMQDGAFFLSFVYGNLLMHI